MTGARPAGASALRRRLPWLLGLAASLALVGAGAFGVNRALGTCESLDRLLGRSGCVAKHRVADFRPLGFHTMVAGGGTTMRLFGFAGRGGALSSVQVAFDWAEGRESARTALPFGPLGFVIHASRDGATVAAICTASDLCDARRPMGYVFDAASGATGAELATANSVDWSFPGERPSGPIDLAADVAAGGELLVEPDPDSGGLVLRRLADRTEIARLGPPDPYRPGPLGPSAIAVRASPDGGRVAVIDNRRLYPSGGSRIDVWNLAERRLTCRLATDARHRIDTNAAWTADGRHLAAWRNWTDMTSAERADGSPLYVFQLC